MATNQSTPPTAAPVPDDDDEPGLAHLTVVPTNFDPDAPDGRRS